MLSLSYLPADQNVMTLVMNSPVASLLRHSGLQSYQLERELNPASAPRPAGKKAADGLAWYLAERVILAPAVLGGLSRLITLRDGARAIPAQARRKLTLSVFVVLAGMAGAVQAPHARHDWGAETKEGRAHRVSRPKMDLNALA